MQHHAHIARTAPPHMRAHHMAVPPPHSQSQTHMPPLNMGQQTQMPQNHHQQQKQSQLLGNVPVPAGDGTGMISTSSAMRDNQTRLNHQPLPPRQHQHSQSMHTSTQLQKLRQQHQHINNNNNNNINSTNKNNYQQQQPHQYNGSSKTHGNVLPVQSVIQQQQQQQPQQILHHQTSSHQNKHQQPTIYHQPQQQQQQQQPQHIRAVTSMAPQQSVGHLQHQQAHQTNLNATNKTNNTHHLPVITALNSATANTTQTTNNNSSSSNLHRNKYNNNNNIGGSNAASVGGVGGGGMVPKSILQNPNRISKTQQNSAATPNKIELNKVEPKNVSLIDNKISGSFGSDIVKEAPVANVVECKSTAVTVGQENLNVQSTIQRDATKDANKENVKGGEQNPNITSDTSKSDAEKNKNSNILSNIDSNVSKNSREKTPMCHVNELARFNKIIHQYRLTSEKGPAHCKRFTVTLKLGDEEYTAEGFKIKKAQHLAAADALANTKYKHPVPKVIRRNTDGEGNPSRANITPTVELNALAMKLGQQTYYLLDPRQNVPSDGIRPEAADTMMAPRFGGATAPPRMLPPHGMSVGHMINQHAPPHLHMMEAPGYVRRNGPYTGPPPMHGPHSSNGSCMPPRYGPPPQHPHISKYNTHHRYPLMPPPHMGGGGGAHNGMPPPPTPFSQAPHHHHHHNHHLHLPHSRYYAMHGVPTRVTLVVGKQKFIGSGHTLQQAKHDAAARALQVLKVQATEQQNEELNNSQEENDKKSPISMVHEIAIQRSMAVHFKVLREEGPAHMKKFVTACIVGNIVAEGEGNGKKTSKKRAAENMLEELRKLPPLTPTKTPVKRIKGKTSAKGADGAEAAGGGRGRSGGGGNERRKRGSASIKEKSEIDADADNPITRLTQLQQNRKEKDPTFELIAKNGNESSRRREFIVEVTASGMVARGTGNSKKLAKRNAAQSLLLAMGINDGDSIGVGAKNSPAVDNENPDTSICTVSAVAAAESNGPNSSILQPIAELANCRKVPLVSTPAGKVPGILILRQNKKHAARKKDGVGNVTIDDGLSKIAESSTDITEEPIILPASTVKDNNAEGKDAATVSAKPNMVAAEVSNNATVNNTSTTNETTATSSSSGSSSKSVNMHMKEQLLYLATLMGFEVNFSDYPKGVHSEFLTIVTLSTNPPQICHGVGISIEESQNDAARNALKILSELGLNNAAK